MLPQQAAGGQAVFCLAFACQASCWPQPAVKLGSPWLRGLLRKEAAGCRGTEARPLGAGLGAVAHSLVTVDTHTLFRDLLPPWSETLGPSHLEHSRVQCQALTEARHLVPGVQERCCGDLARSSSSSRETSEGFLEEASFELER